MNASKKMAWPQKLSLLVCSCMPHKKHIHLLTAAEIGNTDIV